MKKTILYFFISCTQESKEVSYFDTQPNIDYQNLKVGFNNVPQEAKMRTWLFWMNGRATKKAITQDLEAMKDKGITGALLIDNGGNNASMQLQKKLNVAHKTVTRAYEKLIAQDFIKSLLKKNFLWSTSSPIKN